MKPDHEKGADSITQAPSSAELSGGKPIEVAIIGGGVASVTAAFELTRPEHQGKYHVTLYQVGWRLGGKGASGRGPADRIEEHGLHLWMGFYENAFRLLRECYRELDRDPRKDRFADWRDAFHPEASVGLADRSGSGKWVPWTASFPPGAGTPGDSLKDGNPFSMQGYLVRAAALVRTLLESVQVRRQAAGPDAGTGPGTGPGTGAGTGDGAEPWGFAASEGGSEPAGPRDVLAGLARIVKYGQLASMAGLIEAVGILEVLLGGLSRDSENHILRLLDTIASSARQQLGALVEGDDELRRMWQFIDLVLAILRGAVRCGLVRDPRGFDALDDYDLREWIRLHGAAESSLDSAFLRGIYALVFAYEDGDVSKPRMAAGQALRGAVRMFFTYRGALFWRMKASMGDVVFAPFYQVLKKRGVSFRFFHRLENVRLAPAPSLAAGERPYVEALELDLQAHIKPGKGEEGEYEPLIDVRGLPSWPASPDYRQLVDGERLEREGWTFESHWDRRKVGTKTLRVGEDFDLVVLGVSLGAIPHVCKEIVAQDRRWQDMVTHVKTIATQAFQVWMNEDMDELGWSEPPMVLSGFVQPFDTWADMRQLVSEESWDQGPRSVAYFCGVLPTEGEESSVDPAYPRSSAERVRRAAIRFLNQDVGKLWPGAVRPQGGFRWELLVGPPNGSHGRDKNGFGDLDRATQGDESRFDSQFWCANVNPSDRYVLSLPGTTKYRISPLDNTYDNLTIAGDWTQCGHNAGCVEAAVMSGRLAACALSQSPKLEEIIGYDHP